MRSDIFRRERPVSLACGLAMMLGLAAPAIAQEPPAKTSDVVVVGRQDRDRDRQIEDFVRGMTIGPGTESLARWASDGICPRTLGVVAADAEAITDRLRKVAKAAKISVAPVDCNRPNVLVIFADDKKVAVDLLGKKFPQLFLDAHGDPLHVKEDHGPVTAWHVNTTVDRDGMPIYTGGDGPPIHRTTINPSRIETMARPIYVISVVIIERKKAEGLTRMQLADYAAMRAYSDADPTRAAKTGAPTILTALDAAMGTEVPLSLTEWDLNFLKALYAAPAALYAGAQRGAIAHSMKRGLDGDKRDAR